MPGAKSKIVKSILFCHDSLLYVILLVSVNSDFWLTIMDVFFYREVYAVSIVGPFPIAVTNLLDLTRL